MTIQDLAASGPSISGGKLAPLAVTSTVRWPRLPDVPTFEEAGYKINLVGWNGIMAPAGTPKEITERMSAEIRKLCSRPKARTSFWTWACSPPARHAEMTEIMKTGCAAWGEAVKRAGVEPE